MDTDVQDYDWMLTIKQKVDINGNSSNIPFEVTVSEDNRACLRSRVDVRV